MQQKMIKLEWRDRMNNLKREYRKYDVEDTSASRITRFNQVMKSL